MAKFSPPETFDFSRPTAWPEWKERFLRFRSATKLNKEVVGEVQVSSLIYAMGREADKIFSSFTFDAVEEGQPDPKTDFDTVLSKFDAHFIPKRNVIHERSKFYNRQQQSGESVEQFLRALRDLAVNCAYTDREEEFLRDRLVLGLSDTDVSQKLQLEAQLTLKTAFDTARHYELVKTQLQDQRGQHVNAVHYPRGGRSRPSSLTSVPGSHRGTRGKGRGGFNRGGYVPPTQHASHQHRDPADCGNCGRQHPAGKCPAKGKKCSKCNKLSHFAVVCRSKRVSDVTEADYCSYQAYCDDGAYCNEQTYCGDQVYCDNEAYAEETVFLDTVRSSSTEPPWCVLLQLCGQPVMFKIDTGADVCVIPRAVFNTLQPKPRLNNTNTVLRGTGSSIKHDGSFTATVGYKDKTFQGRCFVVNTETDNLLSREAAMRLGLVQRLDSIQDPLYGVLDSTFAPVKCRPVHITLSEGHTPYSVHTARRVPIPLMQKVKEELQRLKEAGVVEEIQEPTDWCAPMVTVMKKNGSVRICTDFKQLNKAVKRERYMLPTLEDILHKLRGAKVFSKLDATSGFFQLPLDEESKKMTTFITPYGRYFYTRLPQGITSAPEIFQRTVEEILCDQPHTVCFFDDILVFSNSESEHQIHLEATQKKLRSAGLKLNRVKCEFAKKEIEFLGYLISGDGVRIDPSKIEAISKLPDPTNVAELRRFIGMVNFLGRHIPKMSEIMHPLNQLLEKDTAWMWGPAQQSAVSKVKHLITNAPVLAFYDPSRPTIVSADASSFGIGGVLLQDQGDGLLQPIAYCSKTLSPAERDYAQIEKECLAAVWACERFDRYLVGLPTFVLETDHKPLVPLINTKDLSETPLRCQRLLMRLARFNVQARYTQGKNMHVADALSRTPLAPKVEEQLNADVVERVNAVTSYWPASDTYLEKIRSETAKDPCLQIAVEYTKSGWPEYKEDVKLGARNLYPVRGELSIWNGLLVKGERIVIPYSLQKEVLEKIHEGHMGMNKCRERANDSVWWPHITQEIKDFVSRCRFCIEKQPSQRKEPLLPSELPDRPFQRMAVDICEHKGAHFLIAFDYYSRYIDICYLRNLTSRTVVMKMKKIFAQHGIPETLISDNGTQFTSAEFQQFSSEWNFRHATSSPHFPQANGAAERAVRTAKDLLKQTELFRAILAYRATPIPELGASPAELAFGRKLRTTLPALPSKLTPNHTFTRDDLQSRDSVLKQRQKMAYDQHHGVQPLPSLQPGDPVVIKSDGEKGWKQEAEIIKLCAPRSYLLKTPNGELRRNRRHIRPVPTTEQRSSSPTPAPVTTQQLHTPVPDLQPSDSGLPLQHPPSPTQPPGTFSRSGRRIVKPSRFED